MQLTRRLALDPFTADASRVIAETPDAGPVVDSISNHLPGADPMEVLLLVMQAVEVEASEPRSQLAKVECVATLPVAAPVQTRPTHTVIREMLDAARQRVFLAGYLITDMDAVIPMVHRTAGRGIAVTIVCDSGTEDASRILASWPEDIKAPRLLVNQLTGSSTGKMHAKVLLVDENDLLVTSANFTHHGQSVNVEYGLRLSGEPARQTAVFFRTIEEHRVLVEYP